MDEGGFETREGLIAFARANGYEVEDRLARWHRAGLLPRPEQRSKGKGQGTDSRYPAGTHIQLLALLRIHEDRGEKRFSHVAWRLWWDGFDIPMDQIRAFLLDAANIEVGPLPRWGSEVLKALEARKRVPKPLGRIRRKVGRDDFETVVRLVLETARGSFSGFESDEEEKVMDQAFGLTQVESLVRAVGQVPDRHTSTQALLLVSNVVREHGLSRAAQEASDEGVVAARDELRELLGLLETLGEWTGWVFGRKAYPYTLIRRVVQGMAPRMQAGLLLMFLALRSEQAVRDGIATLLETKERADAGYRSWQAIQAMGREIPATADLLTPERFRVALRSHGAMERLQQDIARVRDLHLDQFDAFFAAHPDAALLAEQETGGQEQNT